MSHSPPPLFPILFIAVSAAAIWAAPPLDVESDDPLLDARIQLNDLSRIYAEHNPKIIEARTNLATLALSNSTEPLELYFAHVRERIQVTESVRADLARTYLSTSPRIQALDSRLVFLRKELLRKSVY